MTIRTRVRIEALSIAASFAMCAAAAQLVRNAYVRHVAHGFTRMSDDAIWMTPLAFLVIFLAIAVVALLASLLPSVTRRAMLAGFGTLAAWSALLHFSRLHSLASLALALGIGAQLAAFIERAPERRLRGLHRLGIALGLCFAIGGAWQGILRLSAEQRTLASLPAADAEAPNVVLIVLDTVRASSMSLYGSKVETTPFLERFAAESTVFDQAIAPSSWTLPSHASLFTGIVPSQLGITTKVPLHLQIPTIADALQRRGYATAAFTANYVYTTRESGLAQGFAHFEDHVVSFKETLWHANLTQMLLGHGVFYGLTPTGLWRVAGNALRGVPAEPRHELWNASEVAGAFLAWRNQGRRRRPYFAFLNMFDAHGEFEPPAPFDASVHGLSGGWKRYDRNIAFLDSAIERLVVALRQAGELDRTIFVVTSDHGHQFGEHRLYGHGNSLYAQLLHVPLLIRYPPGLTTPTRVPEPVSLMDLAATIAALSGDRSNTVAGRPIVLAPPPMDWPPALAVTNKTEKWDGPSDRGPMVSVFDGALHYIRRADGVEELYAHGVDPEETHDLSRTVTGRQSMPRLRELADTLARASRRP